MKVIGYPLTNMGTNCYLAYDENTGDGVLFDPAEYSEKIHDFIKTNNIKLRFIILTHGHGDHIGGVTRFKSEFPGVRLVAGKDELVMLKSAQMNYSGLITGNPIELIPEVLAEDGNVLTAGALDLKIIATPGHSEGGISVLMGDALFSGDTLFRESIGRTDLPGGDFQTLLNSIRNKLFILPDDTVVYPGHMGTTSIGHEKERNPFVRM